MAGFKKRARENQNPYIKWRLSQGFSHAEAELLFEGLDGGEVPLSEARVFVQTIQTENYYASQATNALSTAFGKIADNDITVAKHYAKHINRITTVCNLAATGHYQSSGILLRNCIEAFLRSNFLFVNEYADGGTFPEIKKYSEWENAISHDPVKALSIGPMCKLIKKMGFAKPIKNPYHYMKMDTLNQLTHAHLSILKQSDDNAILRQSLDKSYDRESFKNFVTILQRFIEFQLVVWQHLCDRTNKIDQPLISLAIDNIATKQTYPKYHQLLEKTRPEFRMSKRSNKGCKRCRMLSQQEDRPMFDNDDLQEYIDQLAHGRNSREAIDDLTSKISNNYSEANKKMPPHKRARIEPGRIVVPCPNKCGNGGKLGGWTLYVTEEPILKPDKFSCSQGLRRIVAEDPHTGIPCDLCETRGVIITDCDCI